MLAPEAIFQDKNAANPFLARVSGIPYRIAYNAPQAP